MTEIRQWWLAFVSRLRNALRDEIQRAARPVIQIRLTRAYEAGEPILTILSPQAMLAGDTIEIALNLAMTDGEVIAMMKPFSR